MTAPTPPDYSAWKYRAIIRITNPTTTAAYQHKLTLAWRPGMRRDFRDIRFTQQNGINCPYWIESSNAGSAATVWIKVPSTNQGLLHLYYGNGAAVSASSSTGMFEFFDNFPGSSIDTSKWNTHGTVTVSGGEVTLSSSPATQSYIQWKTVSFTDPVTLEANIKFQSSSTATDHNIGFANSGRDDLLCFAGRASGAGTRGRAHTSSSIYSTDIETSQPVSYERWMVKWIDDSNGAFYVGGVHQQTISNSQVPDSAMGAFVENWKTSTAGCNIYCNLVIVRKYAATEPVLAVSITGINPVSLPTRSHRIGGIALSSGTEYSWDPVNVDHGMVASVGAQEIEMTTNVNHGMIAGVGGQEVECGAVNIYHPMYPTASWAQIIDPVVDSGYLISVTVSQSMDDAMAEATFEYDGDEIGNYFSGDYRTKVHVNIPDYNGVSRCVFVGQVPSSHAVYDLAKKKTTLKAVDYGLFLSQKMATKDLSLLPPANQTSEGANVAKELHYDGRVKYFQIGMSVRGAVSNATGTIISVVSTTAQMLTLYPATGKFIDDEELLVGGVMYAYADGRSIDIPYTPYYSTTAPEDWVRSILAGTGIEPYCLESSGGYWNTSACPAIPFMFGSLEKKRDALKRLAAYMEYMWHVKPRNPGSGVYIDAGYFIKKTSIDTLLDLPATASLGPDDFAVPITLDQDGELQVDVVRVRCQDVCGNWLPDEIRSNSYYDAGEGPYLEFVDEPKDICTQTDLAAYATDMFALYSSRTISWSGTLLARSDLQLYQLITVSGMGIDVPDGTYRITKIAHEYGCAKNLTHISFMLSSAFSILRKYGMTYKDSISKVEQIIAGLESQKPQIELAAVTATDGWTITYTTEAGNQGMGRDSTSTPDVAGAIPIGAKVQIQHTRGGVVCIPIVAASGSSTDLLVVDVPVIVSVYEDPADTNYFHIRWTPGANNENVSVNIQTTTYPSSPGTVLPYGNAASCGTVLFPVSVGQCKCRFSGPNTTYYIKLWGERNGVYSATGATATITSGASVTPTDVPEEPEPLAVIDILLSGSVMASSGTPHTPATVYATLYNGTLTFQYNGSDNIYISGPKEVDTAIETWQVVNAPPGRPRGITNYRHMFIDNIIRITGPNGSIDSESSVDDPADGLVGHWIPPILISSILLPGTNTLKIELFDAGGLVGCSALYIRSYT